MTMSKQVLIIIDLFKIIVLMSILLFTLNPVEDKCVSNVLIVMIMSQARFDIYKIYYISPSQVETSYGLRR